MTETVPPVRAVNDTGHVGDHNLIRTDIVDLDGRLTLVEGGTTSLRTASTSTITVVSGDLANTVKTTYNGLVTVTVPSDTTLAAWAVGQSVRFYQAGQGQIVFVEGSGVNPISALTTAKRTKGKGSWVTLRKIAANTYSLEGDLAGPQDTFPSRLSTSGRNLVDANGFVMPKLKGFNVQTAAWSQQNYNDMAALGAKIQRLTIFWEFLEPTQGNIDTSWLATWVQPCIDHAEAAGMYTMLSFHLNTGHIPTWVQTFLPSVSNGEDVQYVTYGQNATTYLANRWGNPASSFYTKSVIGMGLNELPVGDGTIRNGTGMHPYTENIHRQMITWMRVNGAAPDWIGFVCTAYGGATPTFDTYSTSGNGATPASQTAYDSVGGNVVLDFHDYTIGMTSNVANDDGRLFNGIQYPTYQGGPMIGTDDPAYEYTSTATARGQMAAYVDPFKRFSEVSQIPLMLGEWGYPSGHPTISGEEAWIADMMAIWGNAGTCIEMQWLYNNVAATDKWSARPVGYAFRPSIQIWTGQTWSANATRRNESYTTQSGFATDTYLTGSTNPFPANMPQVATRYRLKFAMTKTAAGTAAPVLTIRIGTPSVATVTNKALTSNVATITTSAAHGFLAGQTVAVAIPDATFAGTFTIASVPLATTFTYAKTAANVGSTATGGTATRPAGTLVDPAILTFTFGAGTVAADTGEFNVDCVFRTVGNGTTAVLVGSATLIANQAAAGISSTTRAVQVASSGFDSTAANQIIGASFNGGASFAGTCQLVDSELVP